MYSREIDNRILTLSATGWTYRNTFILYDYETESLWYHFEGKDGLRCINGFYADRNLEEFASMKLRWNRWLDEYPDSKFLKKTRGD